MTNYFLVQTCSQSNFKKFTSNDVHLVEVTQSPKSKESWNISPTTSIPANVENICTILDKYFQTWIDELGIESAEAQQLKQPITTSETLRNGGLKPASPVKYNDTLYLLITEEPGGIINPVAFLRIGKRCLYFDHDGQLEQVRDVLCALDFYSRIQRRGIGYLLLSSALKEFAVDAYQLAFDRPTSAMLLFLSKHFGLTNPIEQHNHFVIFAGFFEK